MFQWDKSIRALNLSVEKIAHLFRSMRDVQLALPGLPAQEASAYLCQYQAPEGIGTSVIFHLHKSDQLAFYDNTPKLVAVDKAEAMLDQATVFVESMGFLMTDLDIHLLNESDREMLWSSLPLQKGITATVSGEKLKTSSPPGEMAVSPSGGQRLKTGFGASLLDTPKAGGFFREEKSDKKPVAPDVPAAPSNEAMTAPDKGGQENVDDLLAAVEALRTRRPGVRARKKTPSPEELKRRRQELFENVGRILASQ